MPKSRTPTPKAQTSRRLQKTSTPAALLAAAVQTGYAAVTLGASRTCRSSVPAGSSSAAASDTAAPALCETMTFRGDGSASTAAARSRPIRRAWAPSR